MPWRSPCDMLGRKGGRVGKDTALERELMLRRSVEMEVDRGGLPGDRLCSADSLNSPYRQFLHLVHRSQPMKRNFRSLLAVAVAATALSATALLATAWAQAKPEAKPADTTPAAKPDVTKPSETKPAKPADTSLADKPKIQMAILLDTSNSMDGLIGQARSQLWKIVN